MNSRSMVLNTLDNWEIPYKHYTHKAAHTISDCLMMDFIKPDVVICKNIFLCNRQMTQFYLMLLHPDKSFRTAEVSKALGVSRLSFAPDTLLPDMLSLLPGAVSPLGLLFDRDHRVTLICDRLIQKYPRIAFHPCVNTETVVFDSACFFEKVLKKMNVEPVWV